MYLKATIICLRQLNCCDCSANSKIQLPHSIKKASQYKKKGLNLANYKTKVFAKHAVSKIAKF